MTISKEFEDSGMRSFSDIAKELGTTSQGVQYTYRRAVAKVKANPLAYKCYLEWLDQPHYDEDMYEQCD